MFDKITYITDNGASIRIKEDAEVVEDLMNMHVLFEDNEKKVLAEIENIDNNIVGTKFLGEVVGDKFVTGIIRKPSLKSTVRIITREEFALLVTQESDNAILLGHSPLYNDYPIRVNVNAMFSNHLAIFGNTGSGKSCGVARILQNLFNCPGFLPYNANFIIFDSTGEYKNAFSNINALDPNYRYNLYSTSDEVTDKAEKLRIPLWLLTIDDFALLLSATNHTQIPIIERMVQLVNIFQSPDINVEAFKDHLIAKAIMSILYSNETSAKKRDDIFSILTTCSTNNFSLETEIMGIGYSRRFRECFAIDSIGQFAESVLITKYVAEFIKEEFDDLNLSKINYFTLEDLEVALNFTLISEGWLKNEKTYGDAITLKVRLHTLITGGYARFFRLDRFIDKRTYLYDLLFDNNGRKYQVINFNLEDVDDAFAKVLAKIFSRIVFDFAKRLEQRASIPFNIILEEAHRYIQNDNDNFLLGYNIFDRISKEGRKYGVMLTLVSQRPVEISDTVISQCSNFLIFKMNHPRDVEYIRKMVPNINSEIVDKQKVLQVGHCVGFGQAFKVPTIIRMQLPDPLPQSNNADVYARWTYQKREE
ncbi:MAG: ATP-binding protein [Firmicutes bacterium]|nr:ATP-binding protein [Bacillota bacterium]